MKSRAQVLGFTYLFEDVARRVDSLGFRIQGLRFQSLGLGFRVQGHQSLGLRAKGFRLWEYGIGFWFRVQG